MGNRLNLLNKDIVELDFDFAKELDKEMQVGNIILPFGSGKDGLAKTIVCRIRNLNPLVTKEYGLFIGDSVLVDRYAINQVKYGDSFCAFINIDSIIMVKKVDRVASLGRSVKDRIVDYLEMAPKKCYFSCYNTMAREESVAVAMKHANLIKTIVEAYKQKPPEESFEEFRHRVHAVPIVPAEV